MRGEAVPHLRDLVEVKVCLGDLLKPDVSKLGIANVKTG
jgi:hypothetical protein